MANRKSERIDNRTLLERIKADVTQLPGLAALAMAITSHGQKMVIADLEDCLRAFAVRLEHIGEHIDCLDMERPDTRSITPVEALRQHYLG